MIVKIQQQVKFKNPIHQDASEKFFIFIGEGYTAEYLGLDGQFHCSMRGGFGHYFNTGEEAEKFAEDLGHVVDKEYCLF